MMRWLFMAAALAAGLGACSPSDQKAAQTSGPPVAIKMQSSLVARDAVEKAVAAFKEACSPLNEHWRDVKEIRVDVTDEFADHRLKRGWKAYVHVAVRLSEDPATLPAANDQAGVVAGHTLHYDLGGGSEPGMLGSKRASQMLCGMPISNSGADTFKAVPAMDVLKY